jgi:hypothetical protein
VYPPARTALSRVLGTLGGLLLVPVAAFLGFDVLWGAIGGVGTADGPTGVFNAVLYAAVATVVVAAFRCWSPSWSATWPATGPGTTSSPASWPTAEARQQRPQPAAQRAPDLRTTRPAEAAGPNVAATARTQPAAPPTPSTSDYNSQEMP